MVFLLGDMILNIFVCWLNLPKELKQLYLIKTFKVKIQILYLTMTIHLLLMFLKNHKKIFNLAFHGFQMDLYYTVLLTIYCLMVQWNYLFKLGK